MNFSIRPFDGLGHDRIASAWETNALGHAKCDRKGCRRVTATPVQWQGGDILVWRDGWDESQLGQIQPSVSTVARRINGLPTRSEREQAWAAYKQQQRERRHHGAERRHAPRADDPGGRRAPEARGQEEEVGTPRRLPSTLSVEWAPERQARAAGA